MTQEEEFFPDIPDTGSKYMKLEKGSNKFRILTRPIDGYEYWVEIDEGRKPVRIPKGEKIPVNEVDGQVKYFWAMVVYNYEAEAIQILQLTQKGIQKAIKEYSQHEDYGRPTTYDLTIKRTGDSMETRYSVIASPPKPLDEEIKKLYKETKIDLNKLYASESEPYGGDPWSDKQTFEDEIDEAMEDDLTGV